MHRNADGARLIGDGTADGLADPPGGVGAESESQRMVELLHRAQQADISFLNQVLEVQAAAVVPFGDADNQAQIAFGQQILRQFAIGGFYFKFGEFIRGQRSGWLVSRLFAVGGRLPEAFIRLQTDLDPFGQRGLLFGGQQIMAADLAQVHTHRIQGLADLGHILDNFFDGDARFLLDFLFQFQVALDTRQRCAFLLFYFREKF